MAAMHDLAEKEMQLIESGFKISQMMEIRLKNSSHNSDFTEDDDDDYDDLIQMEFIYDEFFNLNEHNKLLPIAILPEWWIEYGGENWLSKKILIIFRKRLKLMDGLKVSFKQRYF